jgi:hypothetical protein
MWSLNLWLTVWQVRKTHYALSLCNERNKSALSWLLTLTSTLSWGGVCLEISNVCSASFPGPYGKRQLSSPVMTVFSYSSFKIYGKNSEQTLLLCHSWLQLSVSSATSTRTFFILKISVKLICILILWWQYFYTRVLTSLIRSSNFYVVRCCRSPGELNSVPSIRKLFTPFSCKCSWCNLFSIHLT